jgi:hypothetical protein
MKSRCTNPRNKKFKDYGGRGIMVCDKWLNDFSQFIADMGNKPSPNSSIDRIDVNGNYEPSNCRWATSLVQARNKRSHRLVDFNGQKIPLSQACELTGINYRSALCRINAGKHWMPLPPAPETAK